MASQPLLPQVCPPQSMEDTSGASTNVYKGVLHVVGEVMKCICCPLLPCCAIGPVCTVDQGSVGVMTRFGIFERVLPPGLYCYNVMSQNIMTVCMKMQTMEVPMQAAMTKDNLSVKVDAVTFVTVVDPGKAVFQVEKYQNAVKTLASSTLLRVIAEHDLQQIFGERQLINDRLTHIMQDKTHEWGLQVSGVEMRDITIPDVMQRAMAQIAEANREAQAKVIVAEGQRKAAFIFAEAAEAMERQPSSLQLQWFETLRQIASEKNSTVIVPDSVIGSLSDIARLGRMTANAPRPFNASTAEAGSEGSGEAFHVVPGAAPPA
eukprot:CAMPEP_0117553688 /NCGR_PEP_ID=MMETSP0784-20121206/50356_1 /TAXON_ID=39447 /ORGANISM="" /LENGTH=318 /DNA_ID=CAMNT_0005350807 /DNA_START=15 /DNA_END=971 /DNA_ORIENTATION=-